MPWRVLDIGDQVWNVSFAAERRANSNQWEMVLSFSSAGPHPHRFWIPYAIHATSKAAIYTQAETVSDQDLASVLNDYLARQ